MPLPACRPQRPCPVAAAPVVACRPVRASPARRLPERLERRRRADVLAAAVPPKAPSFASALQPWPWRLGVSPQPSRYLRLLEQLRHWQGEEGSSTNLHRVLPKLGHDYGSRLLSPGAQLQFLCMHLAYFALQPGQILQIGPDRHCRVHAQLVDRPLGCTAYLLQPLARRLEGPEPAESPLVLFRGTSTGAVARTLQRAGQPTGWAKDFDPRGIGYGVFGPDTRPGHTLRAWIRAARQTGQGIHLVGNSLGGVLALRALADLPQTWQAGAQVDAFNIPGLDRATAARIAAAVPVRVWLHARDLLPKFGEALPAHAQIYVGTTPPYLRHLDPHRVAFLAALEMDEAEARPGQWRRPHRCNHWPPLEMSRRVAGHLLRGRFPD